MKTGLALALLCAYMVYAETNLNTTENQLTNDTENRMVTCLLLYHYKWKTVESLEYLQSNDTNTTNEIKFKVKAKMLDKCHKTMPQALINQIIEGDDLDAINDTLNGYVEIDLEEFKKPNPDLSLSKDEMEVLNNTFNMELSLIREQDEEEQKEFEEKKVECEKRVSKQLSENEKKLNEFVKSGLDIQQIKKKFNAIMLIQCITNFDSSKDDSGVLFEETYKAAKETTSFSWTLTNEEQGVVPEEAPADQQNIKIDL